MPLLFTSCFVITAYNVDFVVVLEIFGVKSFGIDDLSSGGPAVSAMRPEGKATRSDEEGQPGNSAENPGRIALMRFS